MNRFAAVFLAALALPAAASNLPLRVHFQGRLTDPATNAPRDGAFDMTFKLYDAASGGTALYTETQTGVPVSNGAFSVQLGSTLGLSPDLFTGASMYLGVTVSPDAEMTPRQRLVMAPYAFTAAQLVADSAARVRVGTAYSTFTATGDLTVPGAFSGASASLTGALSAASAALTGALTAQDAALTGDLTAASAGLSGAVTASSGTFTATGAQYGVDSASGVVVRAGTLSVRGPGGVDAGGTGLLASTATLTGTGPGVYSLTTSSSVSVGADLSVAGTLGFGLYYRNLVQNNANCRAACTTAGTRLIGGGCYQTTTNTLRRSFPSSENTDAAAIGTPVVNAATAAFSWTCVFSAANAANACFAICARVEN
ncbi:MAG: hypothetical protein HY079_00220 [Elusimicrobia bacterium]|nr:hypothetical protein [Elusimicrobiota bacterium]